MKQNLVTMANQIADFFRFQGDEASATQSIASHLRQFWAPSMRRDLVACLEHNDSQGMHPLVQAAIVAHRDRLLGQSTPVAGEDALEDPVGGGDAG